MILRPEQRGREVLPCRNRWWRSSGRIATSALRSTSSREREASLLVRLQCDGRARPVDMSLSVKLKQFQLPKCKGEKIARIEFRGRPIPELNSIRNAIFFAFSFYCPLGQGAGYFFAHIRYFVNINFLFCC